jgi:deoxycytidine triphosphate deaminase
MFINPKIAIQEGWITIPSTTNLEKCIQPNAIDFTLDQLFTINQYKNCVISEQNKQMRGGEKIQALKDTDNVSSYWILSPHETYDGLSDFYVNVPTNVAALLLTRSTLIRNGIILASGLYDSGFQGHIGFTLHNRSGKSIIFQGTRVGQIVFVESDNATTYAGGYNHHQGTNAPHQKKD